MRSGFCIYIALSKEGYITLCNLIDKYIHPTLRYKMINSGNNEFNNSWKQDRNECGIGIVESVINTKKIDKVYDITVEDNHNFVICSGSNGENKQLYGIIAHNCQNLSALELKTILSRAGENTKIVLTGDIYQIDNPYVDMLSNGLTITANAFRTSSIATSIMLGKGVRSQLSEEASNRL